jgi:hypothetical protein
VELWPVWRRILPNVLSGDRLAHIHRRPVEGDSSPSRRTKAKLMCRIDRTPEALQAERGRQAAARILRALRRSMSDDGLRVLEQATMSTISASAGEASVQHDATMEQQKLAIATLQDRLQGTESNVSLLDGKVGSGFAKLTEMLSSLALPKHAALGSAVETEVGVEAQRRAEADIAAAAEQRRMRETRQAALQDFAPYERDDLLVPGVAPIRLSLISKPEIRDCADYRNYALHTPMRSDKMLTARQCEDAVAHDLKNVMYKVHPTGRRAENLRVLD